MKKIQNWIFAILFVASTGGATLVMAMPQTASAAATCAPPRLLTFPTWYRGLTNDDCTIKSPTALDPKKGLQIFIWTVALNVIEIMLQLVGYISVGFIIYGGFKFITGTGSPDTVAKARTTILNAVIGLVISIASVGIVTAIAGAIK